MTSIYIVRIRIRGIRDSPSTIITHVGWNCATNLAINDFESQIATTIKIEACSQISSVMSKH